MNPKAKYTFKLEEGRKEPIKDLENALRIVLIDKDTAGAEDITFAYCKFEARTSFHKKHVHKDAEEVMYILSGKGIAGVGQVVGEMVKGDTIFVPRGEVHWGYNPYDEPLEMIFIYTRPTLRSAGYEVVE